MHLAEPHLRTAQKRLAKEVITDLHGADAYDEAVKISEMLFAGDFRSIKTADLISAFKNVPNFNIKEDSLINVLVATEICKSKREANEFLNNGAISVNGEIVKDGMFMVDKNSAIDNSIVIIRKGKKKYFLCSIK